MSNIKNKSKLNILTIFLGVSLLAGTLAIATLGHDSAYAKSKKSIKSNFGEQGIFQPQKSKQSSQCVSGSISALDCNNAAGQFDFNFGNNALGQQ